MSVMILRMRSFPPTYLLNSPLTTTLMVSGTLNQSLPVAKTAAASVEPMPVDNAFTAPYVHVCESAPTMSLPGAAKPSSTISWWHTPLFPISK